MESPLQAGRSSGGRSITDVTKLVSLGSSLDRVARKKTTSRYFSGNRVASMIPKRISEGLGSLLKDETRNVILFEIDLNDTLEQTDFRISRHVFHNLNRLAHQDVEKILANKSHPLNDVLNLTATLAQALLKQRRANGALAYYDLVSRLALSEEGNVVSLPDEKSNIGYIIVQELMILTNQACAMHFAKNDIPALYRNHKRKSNAPDHVELKQSIEGLDSLDLHQIETKINLVAERARTSPSLFGHYGLNVDAYCHVTSPLRRYADLVNQRIIVSQLDGTPVPYSHEQLVEISDEINLVADEIINSKADFMKSNSLKRAVNAVNKERLSGVSKGDLYSFIKMCCQNGTEVPNDVLNELINRIDTGDASIMKCVGILVFYHGVALTFDSKQTLLQACAKRITLMPSLFIHLESKYSVPHTVNVTEEGLSKWRVSASSVVDGERYYEVFHELAGKKSDASQQALFMLLCSMIGVEKISIPNQSNVASAFAGENFKGELFELCSKLRLPAPNVESVSKNGLFESTITVQGENLFHGFGSGSTKITSQQHAAKAILEDDAFKRLVPRIEPKPSIAKSPISALQEHCQKSQLSMPSYTFQDVGDGFQCIASVSSLSACAEGANKKEAKTKAASMLLNKTIKL